MMRGLCAVAALGALLMGSGALADSAAQVKKAVEANSAKMMAAFKKKDLKGVMAVTAPDYSGVDMQGNKTTRKSIEAAMKQYMASTKKVHSTSLIASNVKVKGTKAEGKTVFKMDADIVDPDGAMGPKGATHRMVMTEHADIKWVKAKGTWLVLHEKVNKQEMTLDGKKFPPGP